MNRTHNFEKSLYVGCALTHATDEFRNEVSQFKGILRNEHRLNVLDFLGLVEGTDEDVYDWDIGECVGKASAFLAIYGHPGDGLGYETRVATERGIPMLAVAQTDAKVSRLMTGAAKRNGYPFERYNDLCRDVPALVVRQFVTIHNVL